MRVSTRLFTAAAFVISAGAAAAGDHRPTHPSRYYGLYEHRSVGALERPTHGAAIADPSGTAGREDLGADPFHPEGPGTVQD